MDTNPNQSPQEPSDPPKRVPWYLDEKSEAYQACWWIGLMLILAITFCIVWPMLNIAHE